MDDLKIFTGNANRPLAEKICNHLGIPLGRATVGRFSDGEILVEFQENVRGQDVYVIQPIAMPCNENLMELLVMMDALKRASARCITAVVTYFAYARQDRKTAPRTPIAAKLVADLITTAGANRMLTMDLHSGQIQGFFDIPVDHLYAAPVTLEYIRENFSPDVVVVSLFPRRCSQRGSAACSSLAIWRLSQRETSTRHGLATKGPASHRKANLRNRPVTIAWSGAAITSLPPHLSPSMTKPLAGAPSVVKRLSPGPPWSLSGTTRRSLHLGQCHWTSWHAGQTTGPHPQKGQTFGEGGTIRTLRKQSVGS